MRVGRAASSDPRHQLHLRAPQALAHSRLCPVLGHLPSWQLLLAEDVAHVCRRPVVVMALALREGNACIQHARTAARPGLSGNLCRVFSNMALRAPTVYM